LCGLLNVFETSPGIESVTSDLEGYVTTWKFGNKTVKVLVMDAPGFCDSKGRDTMNIAKMVVGLKEVSFVNTLLIVINS
jgi:hypothetical protein